MKIETLDGTALTVHRCEPRSEIARALVTVFTQPDEVGSWHHQIFVWDAASPIAILYCPFCGRELQRGDFVDV